MKTQNNTQYLLNNLISLISQESIALYKQKFQCQTVTVNNYSNAVRIRFEINMSDNIFQTTK